MATGEQLDAQINDLLNEIVSRIGLAFEQKMRERFPFLTPTQATPSQPRTAKPKPTVQALLGGIGDEAVRKLANGLLDDCRNGGLSPEGKSDHIAVKGSDGKVRFRIMPRKKWFVVERQIGGKLHKVRVSDGKGMEQAGKLIEK